MGVERVSDGRPGVVVQVGNQDLAWCNCLTDSQRRANERNANKVLVRWVGSYRDVWLSRRTLGKAWKVVP